MRARAVLSALSICVIAILSPAVVSAQAVLPSRTVRIQVTQTYTEDENTLKGYTVPAAAVAARIFGYAGLSSVATAKDAGKDAVPVSIEIKGHSLSANYIPGGTLYTGAAIEGTITIGRGDAAMRLEFSGEEEPPSVVTVGAEIERPFGAAFQQSTFYSALLHQIGTSFGTPPLLKALADLEAPVRAGAVREIAAIGDMDAVAAIVPVLRDKDATVACAAAKALGDRKVKEAVQPLLVTLRGRAALGAPKLRLAIVRALGAIAEPDGLPAVVSALSDRDGPVREAAVAAASSMGWTPSTDKERIALAVAQGDYAGAAAFGKAAVAPICAAMDPMLPGEQEPALMALVRMQDPAGLDAVIALAKNPKTDTLIRESAIGVLGKSNEDRAHDALFPLLREDDYSIVFTTAGALGNTGDLRAVAPLTAALKSKDVSLRDTIAGALEKLGWKPGTTSEAILFYPAVGDWDACMEIGDKAVPALVEASRYSGDAAEALKTVGRIGTPTAVTALVKLLQDKNYYHRAEAAAALGYAKSAAAKNALKRALKDDDEEVSSAAQAALDRMENQAP